MKTVVMIDDNEALQKLFQDAFTHEDIRLICANTGTQGLELIRKSPPDLILLDIMLPGGMNGFDVAEALKKEPKLSTIPFIIHTNIDSEKQSAMEIGAKDYIIKANASLQEIIEKIKKFMQ